MGRSRSRDDARPNRPRGPIARRQARRAARVYDANRATRIGDHRNRRPSSGSSAPRRKRTRRRSASSQSFRAGLFFWFFAIALTIVEFFANFPVFRLLLPLKSALAKAAEDAAQDTISADWWAGLALQMKEIVLHADALFVALVAVLFLILFGKTIGGSARVLVALRPKDQPLAATTIKSIRRQHFTALLGSLIGVAAVLTFLYLSRASIASVAAQRVTADSLELQRLKSEAQQIPPGDLGAMGRSAAAIREQTRTLEIHRDDRAYATTVQNNNTPLFFLNLGLVFGAAVLGFLTYAKSCAMERQSTRRSSSFERIGNRSRQTRTRRFRAGRAAESQARASIGRVEHLMTASPLAEWVAKADRLEVVIPLFRGENARLRNMDPASILAFAGKPPLSLPTLEAERGFPEPTDFARLKEEFEVMPSRLRGSDGANSDQPQRRELGMMAARLAALRSGSQPRRTGMCLVCSRVVGAGLRPVGWREGGSTSRRISSSWESICRPVALWKRCEIRGGFWTTWSRDCTTAMSWCCSRCTAARTLGITSGSTRFHARERQASSRRATSGGSTISKPSRIRLSGRCSIRIECGGSTTPTCLERSIELQTMRKQRMTGGRR